ncbi:DUF2125 domain-containing protein [Antarctobacter jejuensis]|uniref:DUF2125 domain-containing protein n=1 Tax=Antarctobacter jejuensis TaxID=1439938 RepID=UPI003FD40038
MKRYTTASVLALAVMAGPAWADLTPQQVWDDFEAYMTGFGYSMTASEAMDGSTLTVSDVTMTIPIPEEEGAEVKLIMPQLTFADNGDGSVKLSYPDVSDITVHLIEDGETFAEIVVTMTQSNVAMNVAGSPGDMTYTYSGDSIALELTRVFGEGEEITRDMLSATIGMGPLSGTSHITQDDAFRSVEQDVSYGDLTYDVKFQDPDNSNNTGLFNGQLTGLKTTGATILPNEINYDDPTSMFKNGGAVDVVISHTGGRTDFTVQEPAGATVGKFSSTGGEFGIAVSEQELTYAISGSSQMVSLSGPELPLPINAQLDEIGFALTMPLSPADAPQDASLSVVLANFAMDDMLWNIFDPSQTLPRDPATIALNLDAKVSPFVSLLDTEKMEEMAMNGGMPGELHSVTLSDFVVDMIGGVILGEGSFNFDMSDFTTIPGVPRPEGELNLSVSGANGIIDKLISMGLMGEQDAMGARMMLSMFTVPGDEPDTATSKIEINEQGHILANGQRIQ